MLMTTGLNNVVQSSLLLRACESFKHLRLESGLFYGVCLNAYKIWRSRTVIVSELYKHQNLVCSWNHPLAHFPLYI
jgi:hypothetical protein